VLPPKPPEVCLISFLFSFRWSNIVKAIFESLKLVLFVYLVFVYVYYGSYCNGLEVLDVSDKVKVLDDIFGTYHFE